MTVTARDLAETYFHAWPAKDFDTLRSILADDATFRGPLGTADDGDSCVAGLRGMAQIMTGLEVEKMIDDGDDVITWFQLHTSVAPPGPVANFMHTEAGKIRTIKVTFDARPFTPPGGS